MLNLYDWPPNIDKLLALHAKGLSASQIAEGLPGNVSRNAVIGKLMRMGFGLIRPAASAPRMAPHPAKLPKPKPPREVGRAEPTPLPDALTLGLRDSPHMQRAKQAGAAAHLRAMDSTGGDARPGAKALVDLGFGDCRWPVSGNGSDTMFCGLDTPDGRTWCDEHHTLGHRPSEGSLSNRSMERAALRAAS